MVNLKKRSSHLSMIAFSLLCSSVLVGCISSRNPNTSWKNGSKKNVKEYFRESHYGVKASPRVALKKGRMPSKSGRYHVGKPYKIRGKWYFPSEDVAYKKVGVASWYGSSFHGRLTANGEIFDMQKLTAAHPTMPLPSYVRVTNLNNQSSVIVRVNDRGPYARNHIIDLSKRAAELLGYVRKGKEQVMVQYLSKAPLHAQDRDYLVASLKTPESTKSPLQSEESFSESIMTAINTVPSAAHIPFPSQRFDISSSLSDSDKHQGMPPQEGHILLPETLDIASALEASSEGIASASEISSESIDYEVHLPDSINIEPISYAQDNTHKNLKIFSKLDPKKMTSDDIVSSWKKMRSQKI